MAVTFFWRCEGTTLDGTDDSTAGDNTATAQSSVTLDAAAGLVGTNGILSDAVNRRFTFTPTSLISPTVGAAACLFRFPTTVAGAAQTLFFFRGAASANDCIFVDVAASQELRFAIRHVSAGLVSLTTTAANLQAGLTYGVVVRWDQPNNYRRIEVYDSAGALIQAVEDLATAYTAPAALDATTGIAWGDVGGFSQTCHIDNCFIADAYAEPLESNLLITSFTQYDSGGGEPALSVGHIGEAVIGGSLF